MADWKWLAFGAAVFAGLTAVLGKVGVEGLSSNLATLLRTIVALGFLCMVVWSRHEWSNPWLLHRRSVIFLALSGLCTGVSWLCYYRALQRGPASLVAPIDKLSLVIAIALSVIFLGERLSIARWIGVSLMTLGALFLAWT